MIFSAGPGLDPKTFAVGSGFHHVSGAIDHRGREYAPIDPKEVAGAADALERCGCEGVGVVSKFSVRNPAHEDAMASILRGRFRYVCLGTRWAGHSTSPGD
jgi:N-methylhydantoinase A/oxoprolinase/acetone carboxylase beta subunit